MSAFVDRIARSSVREPRQRRAKATRDGILRTTLALAAAEGPGAVTTTRVAAETGVSIGTFYRYFEDRKALLLAAYDATLVAVVDQCAKAIAEINAALPAEDSVRIAMDAYLHAAASVPGHVPLLREARRLRPLADGDREHGNLVEQSILLPMIRRLGSDGAPEVPGRAEALLAIMATLVDLLQTSENPAFRQFLRRELDAHALFALRRVRTQ